MNGKLDDPALLVSNIWSIIVIPLYVLIFSFELCVFKDKCVMFMYCLLHYTVFFSFILFGLAAFHFPFGSSLPLFYSMRFNLLCYLLIFWLIWAFFPFLLLLFYDTYYILIIIKIWLFYRHLKSFSGFHYFIWFLALFMQTASLQWFKELLTFNVNEW